MTTRLRVSAVAVAAALAVAPMTATTGETEAVRPNRHTTRTNQGARRGRPLKFGRPARAVTLTLPVDVLQALQAIDGDISRAVVRAVEPMVSSDAAQAGLATFGNAAVIVVPPTKSLKEKLGIELIPVAGGRSILSFDERMPLSEIEVRLGDALADPSCEPPDRDVFQAVADILRTARREGKVAIARRSIIVLQGKGAGEQSATVSSEGVEASA